MRYGRVMGVAIGLLFVAGARATDVYDSIEKASDHQGQTLTIQGTIGPDITGKSTGLGRLAEPDTTFEFHDKFGRWIPTRTAIQYPNHGSTYQITGRIVTDANRSELIFAEDSRVPMIRPPGSPDLAADEGAREYDKPQPQPPTPTVSKVGATTTSPPAEQKMPPWVYWLMGATGLVLLSLVIVMIITMRGGRRGQETMIAPGETIKVHMGTQAAIARGTVKVLPGRFEVMDGDEKLREIRLFQTRDNPGREFLVKRVDGTGPTPANVIGFKSPTVSSNQGKLIYTGDGKYTVVNYADPVEKNPIVLNGNPMNQGMVCTVEDGDTLQIGTVKLQYHAT